MKAMQEAWNAVQKEHPGLPLAIFSVDEGQHAAPYCLAGWQRACSRLWLSWQGCLLAESALMLIESAS